jgi:hypothetical protein
MDNQTIGPKDKVDAYINLYKQQMDRFNKTQDVEWKGNFGVWAMLAAAIYFAAKESVDVSRGLAALLLTLISLVHCGWLLFVHDSQRIDKSLWVLYRNKVAAELGCAKEQQEILSDSQWYRNRPLREFFWTSFEIGMTILLCVLLFVMLFFRTKPVDLNM